MRILIIDDHPLFRTGLESLVRALSPAVSVLQVADLAAAAAHSGSVDLVLLDLNLPGAQPLQSLRRARELFESACLVVVSAQDDASTIHDCIAGGAAGFIPKDTDPGLTEQALRLVLAHGIYLPPKALDQPLPSSAGPRPSQARPADALPCLSPRQQAVLRSLLQGKSNKLIARDIGIAEGTVKAHLWAVYQVLGVQSRAQAMYRAHEMGIIGS